MTFNTVERSVTIPVTSMKFTTGTWSTTSSGGILYASKSAADETTVISIPIDLDRRTNQYGVKLKSVKVPLRITTANLDAAPTCALYRVNMKADSSASTNNDATSLTVTNDGVVTANAADRLLTVTISSPDFDYSTQSLCHYQLDVTLDCAAGSVVRVYSAFAVYDELT